MNDELHNRDYRSTLARQTLAILEAGSYVDASGLRVDISQQTAACIDGTVLYFPAELRELAASLDEAANNGSRVTQFEVTGETTLAAARRIVDQFGGERTLCLNFASAKNPGGGFLGGSQAQEESIARSSALYPSLISQPAYYEANRACRTAIYTEHMILSPSVPVFRNDGGKLLPQPYSVHMLTAPAVNAGAVIANEPFIVPKMMERIEMVLAIAAQRRYERLILGAWGCGVFRNNPATIAGLFAKALLHDRRFCNRFSTVTFAVLDNSVEQRFISPFRKAFDQRVASS